jgi:hypothetical protein
VEDSIAEYLKVPGLTDELRLLIQENMTERKMSPIAIKESPAFKTADGILTQAFWMRAKSIPKYELPFQKVRGPVCHSGVGLTSVFSVFYRTCPTFACTSIIPFESKNGKANRPI